MPLHGRSQFKFQIHLNIKLRNEERGHAADSINTFTSVVHVYSVKAVAYSAACISTLRLKALTDILN